MEIIAAHRPNNIGNDDNNFSIHAIAITYFKSQGYLPVPHDDNGLPYSNKWKRGICNVNADMIFDSKGLSLAMGHYGGLVSIYVTDYKNNNALKELFSGLGPIKTCTVIIGNDAYFIYKYNPEYRDIDIPLSICKKLGITFYNKDHLTPHYGLQKFDISLGKEDIENPYVFHELPIPVMRIFASLCEDDLRPLPIWIPVSNYKYHDGYTDTKMSQLTLATYKASIRFHLSLVSTSFITDREKWGQLAHYILHAGPMIVSILHDFTFQPYSNIRCNPCIDKPYFHNYCEEFYKIHPECLNPTYESIKIATSAISLAASSCSSSGYSTVIAEHCHGQFDMSNIRTASKFLTSGDSRGVTHSSIEHAAVEIIKAMHPHTRYIPMIDSFAIRRAIGEPIDIVKREVMIGKHPGYRYVDSIKIAKEGEDPIKHRTLVDPYQLYSTYHYGTVSLALSVPYAPTEDALDVMRDYVPNNMTECLNTFPGYVAKSCDDTNMEIVNVILNHIRAIIANEDEERYRWIMGRLALMVNKPRYRCETVLVLFGKQRCGKSIFLNFLVEKVFGQAISIEVTGVSKLTGRFNGAVEGKALVIVNEMPDTDDGKSKGKNQFEVMKSLITERNVCIEPKGRECYSAPNFANFIIATNNLLSIHIKRDDSRYVIMDCSTKYVSSSDNPRGVETDEDAVRRKNAKGYFTRLYNVFNNPYAGSYFYTYLLTKVPNEWMERAKMMYKTKIRSIIMIQFESKPYLYYEELVEGLHSLPSSIVVKRTDGNCVTLNNLYNDFSCWCRDQNVNVPGKPYFSIEFPLPSKCVKIDGSTHRVRYIPSTFVIRTDSLPDGRKTPGRELTHY